MQNTQPPTFLKRISLAVMFAGLAITLLSGCKPSSSLIQVQGKILVDGAPAKGAVLLFHPDGDQKGSVSSGTAKDDGMFTLVTNTEPGIPAGSYVVTVTWPDPAYQPTKQEIMMGNSNPEDVLKGRYVTKDRSKIKLEIKSGTSTIAPIELKTK